MGTGIYKYVKGKPVELKPREVKGYIMKQNQWTEEQYNKERYKIKNQLRTLEAFERASGKNVSAQSPVQFLYKEAKTKEKYGADYKPTAQAQRVRSVQSYGSEKSIQKALQGKGGERLGQLYEQGTQQQFKGLLKQSKQAREIFKQIKDPIKREKALSAYATQLHMKRDKELHIMEATGLPFGEAYGYDNTDFDITPYL